MNSKPDDVQLMLPKEAMLHGRWYVGRGRNDTRIGQWCAEREHFTFPCLTSLKFGRDAGDWFTYLGLKTGAHFDDPGGCFQPFRLIDEGNVVEPHEEPGYAISLRFGND